MIIFDDYGQPDYEAMILERAEAWEIAGDCNGACEQCVVSEYCSTLIQKKVRIHEHIQHGARKSKL